MSIIQGNAKQASTRGFYSFPLEQSLRFNDNDSAYLTRTNATADDDDVWTWSAWVKRGNTGLMTALFSSGAYPSPYETIYFTSGDILEWRNDGGGANHGVVQATGVLRDPSAWYHIVVVRNVGTVTIYVNGEDRSTVVSSITASSRTLNDSGALQRLGASERNRFPFDGYMAEVNFIDGQALTADSFGELKNGVWICKDPSGLTYGTNGFHLTFEDDTAVEAFNTVLYNGNNGLQSITGYGFAPDLLWVKRRTGGTSDHQLYDTVRGASNSLESNTTDAEANVSTMASFESDGFKLNGANTGLNNSGSTYVAWGWKAGDSNVSNTDGSITSTVRANDIYGFSIVGWQANNQTVSTVGHGLGVAPDMVIIKNRTSSTNAQWVVGHSAFGFNGQGYLNSTGAFGTNSGSFNNTAPTSTVFTVGTDQTVNLGTNDYIAYCWAEKTGYSKFGSYSGGTANYKVTTDFRPSLVLVKRTDSTSDWQMFDGTRDVSNPVTARLNPNQSYAELTNGNFDILDDGFELNDTSAGWNASGGTYIYAAFADTREAAFWLDQSGNDNDWQPVNLDHNDTVADSPTDNFCTWNPLNLGGGTLSDGNLNWSISSSTGLLCTATMAFDIESTTNQFYWEVTLNSGSCVIGIAPTTLRGSDTGRAGSYGYYDDGNKYSGVSASSYGASYTAGDTIGVAVGSGKITFYKNGVSQGDAFTGLTGTFVPFIAEVTCNITANFGQQPFKYDPPE